MIFIVMKLLLLPFNSHRRIFAIQKFEKVPEIFGENNFTGISVFLLLSLFLFYLLLYIFFNQSDILFKNFGFGYFLKKG